MHDAIDLARDIIAAIVAGLFLAAVSGFLADRRAVRQRLDRHAEEISNLQRETKVTGIYPREEL